MATEEVQTDSDRDVLQVIPENMPQKRLTRLQRAKLEALEAFGNHDFDSIVVKTTDFREKLKSTVPRVTENNGTTKTLTRMQKARLEANKAFKNIKLDGKQLSPAKRIRKQESDETPVSPKITKLQKARQEAVESFKGISLDNMTKKMGKVEREKSEMREMAGEESDKKPGRKSVEKGPRNKYRRRSSVSSRTGSHSRRRTSLIASKYVAKSKRQTKAQIVDVALSLPEDLSKESVHVGVTEEAVQNSTVIGTQDTEEKPFLDISSISPIQVTEPAPKRLTRLEKAKLEALQSFSGKHLDDICKSSARILAKYLQPKKDQATNTEVHQLCNKMVQTEKISMVEDQTMNSEGHQLRSEHSQVEEIPMAEDQTTNSGGLKLCNEHSQTEKPNLEDQTVNSGEHQLRNEHSQSEEIAKSEDQTVISEGHQFFNEYNSQTVIQNLEDQTENLREHQLCNENSQIEEIAKPEDQTVNPEGHQFYSELSQTEIPKPNVRPSKSRAAVYSIIVGNSFMDQSTLLETSRRVVETAKQLETPEGSPMVR